MSDLEILRICAILHDIGKPECWLRRKPWSEHIYYTEKTIMESLGEPYATTAARHHEGVSYPHEYYPQSELERIICLADNLASGADRPEEPKRGPPLPRPPVLLTHVLSRGEKVRVKIGEGELETIVFEIKHELEECRTKEPAKIYSRVYLFLKERLHGLPTETRSPINDVSLWHHLKLTSAISTCIWLDGGFKRKNPDKYTFSLLSGDANKISRFINVSRRLPDLRAGSRWVKRATLSATKVIEEKLGPECVIFKGGGSFLALAPQKMAGEIAHKAEKAFESATSGELTITVSEGSTRGFEIKNRFGELWHSATLAIRLKKLTSPPPLVESVEGGIKVCDVCGLRPAVHETEKILPYDAAPRPEMLCENCYRRRSSEDARGVDFDMIADQDGFIGIVKLDGDDMGEVLRGEKLKKFEKEVTLSRLSTVSEMVHEVSERSGKVVNAYGGECIYAGGDDVLAVLPGKNAFDYAREMASLFSKETAGELTSSAGVVAFKEKFPCYIALELVSQLIENAKKQPHKGSIDFEIVSAIGATPTDVNLERRTEQRRRGVSKRPYKWGEFGRLLDYAMYLGKGVVPASQLHTIAGIARYSGVEEAQDHVKYQMGRFQIPWWAGEELIEQIGSGFFLDAFGIYNTFYKG